MKKIISILLVAVSLIGMMPVQAYEFKDNDILTIDMFEQTEDSLGQWFMWLPMDTLNHRTYHDMLKSDFAGTFHELIVAFDIGVVDTDESRAILNNFNLSNGLGKIFYLDEIQQTFNEVYNTDINMASLDGLAMGDNHTLVRVIDNYFIVMQIPHGTNVNPNPNSVSRLGENSEYWTWYYQDEWNTNDLIYTVISYKNIAGYDVRTIDYIGFNPPSDEFLQSYNESNNITVTLNGINIEFDQPPIIVDGRTLVPLRAIFEALGVAVEWNGNTGTVTATKGDIIISLTIGNYYFYKNSRKIDIDVPGMIVNDRTLVPVRAISEALDCEVEWDGNARRVTILGV